MVMDGVNLWFGYTLTEEEMRELFDEEEFKNYCLKLDEKECNQKATHNYSNFSFRRDINSAYVYKFHKFIFKEYVDNLIGMKMTYDNQCDKYFDTMNHDLFNHLPECAFLPCCAYHDNSDWIIGIKIVNISGFDLTSRETSIFKDMKHYDFFLERCHDILKLDDFCDQYPKFYGIADDCQYCS